MIEPQLQTKLEQFTAKTGSVIVMGSSNVGTLRTREGGVISIEVRELTDAGTGSKQSGIVIRVAVSGEPRSAYIDADEIESLIAGIDYIAKLSRTSTTLESFQWQYRTRGNLGISTFASGTNDVEAAIKVGQINGAIGAINLTQLATFRQFLRKALDILHELKSK